MSILWVLLLTLQACHSQAVDEHLVEKDEHERQDCPSESCSANRRPVTVVQSETLYLAEPTRQKKPYDGEGVIKTNFTCERKPYIPGFYADEEADCKIFHLCMETVVEHYVCPNGTAFDQLTLVCEPEDKVHCLLTRSFYAVNADFYEERPLFPGVRPYSVKKEEEYWLQDILSDQTSTRRDAVERNLIKMLILIQYINVPDFLIKTLDAEQITHPALEIILNNVFPLLPVMYSSEPVLPEKQDSSRKRKRVIRSANPAEAPTKGRSMSEINEESSKQTAGRIVEFIIDIIGKIAGKVSGFSRNTIAAKYIQRFLNKYE